MPSASLRIMVVDEDEQRAQLLMQTLRADGYEVVGRAGPGDYLPTLVADAAPDVILVDTQSPSRDVLEQLSTLHRDDPRPVVMFSMDDNEQTIEAAVRAGVTAYIVDGLSKPRVSTIMHTAIAHFRQYQELRKELLETRTSLDERKLVDRAKGLIMQRRGVNEQQAYRMLRDAAMNTKKRIGQVAQDVIAQAEANCGRPQEHKDVTTSGSAPL